MTKYLYTFSGLLQRLFCCCFSSSKSDDNAEKKTDDIVEDAEIDQSIITNQNVAYLSGRNTYPSHFQRPMELEEFYRSQDYPINGLEFMATNDKTTSKCKSCQADFDKDKAKDKNKKRYRRQM